MPGPLHAPPLLILFPFRFRDPVSGKWVRAQYVAERHELAARYAAWGSAIFLLALLSNAAQPVASVRPDARVQR